jgi:hypothetical protein
MSKVHKVPLWLHVNCKMDHHMDVIHVIYMVDVNRILTLWASCMKVVSDNHHTIRKNVAFN